MLSLVALALAAGAAAPVPTPELLAQRDRADVRAYVTRAVFAEGRLWVRSAGGAVYSLAPGEARVRIEPLPEDAIDLCTVDRRVVALTASGEAWTVRRHEAAGWTAGPSFTVRPVPEPPHARGTRNRYLGVACAREGPTVVFSEQLVVVRGRTTKAVQLSTSLAAIPMISTATVRAHGRELLVGLDRGEWGGGVWRVHPRSGAVTEIPGVAEPVYAIAPIAGPRGCVAVAAGTMHLGMTTGALYQVCGDDVLPLVRRRLDAPDGRTSGEVTFVGVARVGDRLVAAGLDGLYTVRGDGITRDPFPVFAAVDGVHLTFDVADVALVMTETNRMHAMAPGVPILVARE